MKFKKSSPELVERFRAATPKHDEVQPKQMFGYPCCFVKGNFFVGLFEEDVVMRLPGIKDKFPELAGASGFNPMGKGAGMKDWWIVPPEISRDAGRLESLLGATFGEVVKLPAKSKAARKRATGTLRSKSH
ncbi:MAG: TfoX/Sxy family protein [Bryobacteraceae bacterium]